MSDTPKNRILIVDDDPTVRATVAMLLADEGHEVSTAEDGFDALLHMKSAIPELIVSDLNMPQMSGFEFLSVIRRRFPQVLVVAMSGAYQGGDAVPGGVIADAFYPKGSANPGSLSKLVADLLQNSASRASAHVRQAAPVWVPRNGKDSRGIPYIVLTCTECLRSFPLNVSSEATAAVMATPCIFCLNEVRYIVDFSLTVASPRKQYGKGAAGFSLPELRRKGAPIQKESEQHSEGEKLLQQLKEQWSRQTVKAALGRDRAIDSRLKEVAS